MRPPAVSEAPVRGAQALARRLREDPAAVKTPVRELAREYGLPESSVEDAVRSLTRPPEERVRVDLRSIGSLIGDFLLALTARPYVFLFTTSFLALAAFTLLVGFAARPGLPILITLGLLIGSHVICFYRHGNGALVAIWSVVMWAGALATALLLGIASGQRSISTTTILALALVMLMMTVLYASLGFAASVLGAYRRVRRHERQFERMDRGELLQRLFELRAMIQYPRESKPDSGAVPASTFRNFERHPWLYTIFLGLALNVLQVQTLVLIDFDPHERGAVPPPIWIAAMVVFFALGIFAYFAVAFLSRNAWLGYARALLLFAVGLASTMAYGAFRPGIWLAQLSVGQAAFSVLTCLMLASLGVLAGRVNGFLARQRRIDRMDPSAVLAEIVRIEWRLAAGASEVCVVVVDASRSTEMKASGDALDAEFSFREYQSLLAKTATAHSGEVHSTAGDGAVLAFRTADDAFAAARRIQTEIERFNQEVSRLPMPFRLRIGIHMGVVPGELDEVQFSHVIDVAAHVEANAPVGGILVTQSVASRLMADAFAPLAEPVDGEPVLLALQPTVDA